MTALERYIRLEALGAWRESPEAPPREVVVAFGNATLVLSDLADHPLTHWSLAGTRVIRSADGAAVYSTTDDGWETLELRDPEMIAAIAAVTAAELFPRIAPPRRRRPWLGLAFALGLAALAVVYLPGQIRQVTARMVPPELAERLGDEVLLQIIAREGAPCADPAGRRALAKLTAQAEPDEALEVHMVGLGAATAAVLPERLLLTNRSLVGAAASPEEIAGWIALALAEADLHPPIQTLLATSPLTASLRLLFTGHLRDATLAAAAARTMAPPVPGPAALAAASARLATAGIPTAPLAEALRQRGLPVAAALDPAAPDAPSVLSDQEWVALQAICD